MQENTSIPYHVDGLHRANKIADRYRHVSGYQGIMLLLCASNGASILVLPSILGAQFQTKAYLLCIGGVLFSLLSCTLVHFAYQKTKSTDLNELFRNAFGSLLGTIINALFRLSSLFRAGITVGIFASAVKGLMLPDTACTAITLLICFVLLLTIRCTITASARVCSISMLFLFCVLLLMLTCLPSMHSAYILPFDLPIKNDWFPMLPYMLFCGSGFDLMLYLYPAMQSKPYKTSVLAAFFSGLIKLYTLLVSCSIFGFYAIENYTWPLISMFKTGNFIGIDRPELIFMIFFTVISLTPAYLMASCAIRSKETARSQNLPTAIFAVVAVFLLSLLMDRISRITALLSLAGYFFLIFGILLPILLILFGKRRTA